MSKKCILHDVRVDDSIEKLLFASEEDAERFCGFVYQYQRSGPGNGYGAYWVFEKDIQFPKDDPLDCDCALETERIECMAKSILSARRIDVSRNFLPPVVGIKGGAITFDWELLTEEKFLAWKKELDPV